MSGDLTTIINGLELKIKALEDRIKELVRRNHDSLMLMAPNSVFEANGPEPIQVDAGWQPMRNQPCQQISRAVGNCRSIWADNNATNCFLIQPEIPLIGLIDSGESNAGLGSMGNTFGNKWNNIGTSGYLTPIELLCYEKSRDDILYSTKLDESYNEATNEGKYSNRNMVKPKKLTSPGCIGNTMEAPGYSSRLNGIPSGLPKAGCTCMTRTAPGYFRGKDSSGRGRNTQECILYIEALIKWIIKNHKNELIQGLIAGAILDKEFRDFLIKELLKQCPNCIDYNALLTLDETAAYLKVCPRTVYSLIEEGKLKPEYVGSLPRFWLANLKLNLNLGLL